MLTIFAIPKPFYGHTDIIQRNAILSWSLLQPQCEIILFNDEKNTTCKVAKEFGVRCITDIKRDEFGIPLLSEVFNKIHKIANEKIIAHVNPDVILMSDFLGVVKQISFSDFLIMGRVWDLDVKEKIDLNNVNWEQELRKRIKKEGKLQGFSAANYWVSSCHSKFDFPLSVTGQRGVENWLIFKARSLKVPVIDATEAIDIVHQKHEAYKKKRKETTLDPTEMCTLRDADWVFTADGLKKPPYPRRLFNKMSLFYPWRLTLGFKRKIQKII